MKATNIQLSDSGKKKRVIQEKSLTSGQKLQIERIHYTSTYYLKKEISESDLKDLKLRIMEFATLDYRLDLDKALYCMGNLRCLKNINR